MNVNSGKKAYDVNIWNLMINNAQQKRSWVTDGQMGSKLFLTPAWSLKSFCRSAFSHMAFTEDGKDFCLHFVFTLIFSTVYGTLSSLISPLFYASRIWSIPHFSDFSAVGPSTLSIFLQIRKDLTQKKKNWWSQSSWIQKQLKAFQIMSMKQYLEWKHDCNKP